MFAKIFCSLHFFANKKFFLILGFFIFRQSFPSHQKLAKNDEWYIMDEYKNDDQHRRVSDPADPDRCQAVSALGQCLMYRTTNSNVCARHGGTNLENVKKKEDLAQYRLAKYKARIEDFATNPKVLTLRDEIGITRMLLETKLNKWQDDDELIAHSGVILANIQALHKIVVDCKKLESSMGMLLDRGAVQKLCDGILNIMSRYLDEEQMKQVAELVLGEIAAVTTARVALDENNK